MFASKLFKKGAKKTEEKPDEEGAAAAGASGGDGAVDAAEPEPESGAAGSADQVDAEEAAPAPDAGADGLQTLAPGDDISEDDPALEENAGASLSGATFDIHPQDEPPAESPLFGAEVTGSPDAGQPGQSFLAMEPAELEQPEDAELVVEEAEHRVEVQPRLEEDAEYERDGADTDTEEGAEPPMEDMPADEGQGELTDDEDVQSAKVEGAYDPADYAHLVVNEDIQTMFQFIISYTPQHIELEHRLKPFIPDFIPAIGDIDAFIKVERPDGKADTIGLSVLDEPRAQQSDKNVLDLQLRAVAKTTSAKQSSVATVDAADRNPKAVEKWIKDIGDLHKSKPAPSVHYNKPMPDIDYLMQEWPGDFEEVLQSTHLPTADLDCDLSTYVEIICGIMDIPVYKSKVQSLHVLFTLYSAFKSSGHFGQQQAM